MKKRFGYSAILGFLAGFVLLSCNSGVMYDAQVDLPEAGWYKDEAVKFDIDITDTLLPYDFNLNINHTTDYRYANLFLFMITRFPDGKMSRDTLEVMMAYPNGKWLGKGWGTLRDRKENLRVELFFPRTGVYTFYLQQAMRVDTLKDIRRIGLQVVLSGGQVSQNY